MWSLVSLALCAWLMRAMPADGFYAGDPGVKLIAAANAIAHPDRPLDIDLPRIGDRPTAYVERFFAVHDDHAHALQSPVFPLLSAPLIAMWGLRGAYVLPLICFVALVPLVATIRRRGVVDAPLWLLALITVAANPLFFYALEFWEHVPAATLLTAATALVLGHRQQAATGVPHMLAGALTGLAVSMRPESFWYALTLFVIAANSMRQVVAVGIGLAVTLGAFAAANYAHSGNVLGPHMAANLAPLLGDWAPMRWSFLQSWFGPSSGLAGSGLVVIGVSHMSRLFGIGVGHRQVIALCGVAMIGVAAAAGQLRRETIWNAWPLFGVLLVPGLNLRQPLWWLAALPMIMVVVTSPHDGGAQWGPRFLLVATPALLLLVAAAGQQLLAAGQQWQRTRTVLLCLIMLSSIYVSRNAFRELRGTKQFYSRIVAATQAAVPEGGYLLTNVWWFDQITAPLYGRHTALFAGSERDYRSAIEEMAKSGIRNVTLVSSGEDDTSAQSTQWVTATCLKIVAQTSIPERLLEFEKATCE